MMLKLGSPENLTSYIRGLQKEVEMVVKSVGEMAYYMRGAVQYEHIMLRMSRGERDVMEAFLSKRLEQEVQSLHPVY